MREKKDSRLSFLGDIPSHWILHPVYYYFGERKHKNTFGLESNLLSLSYGKVIRKDINTNEGLLPASFNTYNIIEADDIVIRPTDLQNDKRSLRTGLAKEHGIITSAYIALMPIKPLNSGYFHYLLHAFDVMKVFYNMGNGVRQGLNYSEFSRLIVMEPPKEEQDVIVSFLDAKCAEIDALIADIQTQIDTLEQYKSSVITEAVTKGLNPDAEMKDSGIFYMAPINANWRLTKIGYICTKLIRPFESEDKALICSNKGKVLIRPDDLTGIMVSEDNAMQGICKGDIAIHGMDTWHGAIALSDYDGKITRVVHVCNSTEDKRFIVYYLQHLAYQGVYKLISNGVRGNTSDFRSWDKFRDICIAVPERKQEQQEICDYLDKLCIGIDEIIAAKKEQLTVLDGYKKSLIFEYVTGKKEISEAVTVVGMNPHVPLLAMVVDMLKRPRGKVVDQKLLYLCDVHLALGLSTQYYRYDYGPLDLQLDTYIDTLVSNGWYTVDTQDRAKILVKAENHVKALEMYGNQLSQNKSDIEKIVQYFGEMRMGEIERFATLFAVWNDFIIDGVSTPSDNQIIDDVLTNWGSKKGRFSRGTWQNTLMKMKRNGIIPKGLGLHTLPKPEGGKSDA